MPVETQIVENPDLPFGARARTALVLAFACLVVTGGCSSSAQATTCIDRDWWALELQSVEQIIEGTGGADPEELDRWDEDAQFWQLDGVAKLYDYQGETVHLIDVEKL